MEGLKTYDKLSARELVFTLVCLLYNTSLESHHHLFFECPFSMDLVRNILPILRNISALIVVVIIYMIWVRGILYNMTPLLEISRLYLLPLRQLLHLKGVGR